MKRKAVFMLLAIFVLAVMTTTSVAEINRYVKLKGGHVIASTKELFNQAADLIIADDMEALEQLIALGGVSSTKEGLEVEVVDRSLFGGFAKIRPKGQLTYFWTTTEAITLGDRTENNKKVSIKNDKKTPINNTQIIYLDGYKVAHKEIKEYRAIVKKLSSYTSMELAKLPYVIRQECRIVVPEGLSEAQIKKIAEDVVSNELYEDNEIDEMIIFIYDNESDVSGAYTIGKAIWGIDGELGNISPQIAENNDKSMHKVTFDIKKTKSKNLSERELMMARTLDKALWDTADNNLDTDEEVIVAKIADKFGISVEELDEIYVKFMEWKFR